ncbi:hypothetical protein PN441_02585 [Spirulina major CS-329]|uniref:hypothetical protein n=1 Tax=Spirulina TaxID=1154 RepID=UPI00232C87F3|nr:MULTISPECIES: hypothetical protein [Spirulina]MDB9495397.1 hypothetical protein [Spirulina subsalsa CS-330]MDB9501942.1 hypothetical protein [Spirulina major CS-329]
MFLSAPVLPLGWVGALAETLMAVGGGVGFALDLRGGATVGGDYFLVGEYLGFDSGFGRVSVWLIRLFCCCFFFGGF